MNKINTIENLASILSKLPGLGIRSARRMVLFLIKNQKLYLDSLIHNLKNLRDNIKICNCGNLDDNIPCNICSDSSRDTNLLCVVEDIVSLWAIERPGIFNGLYYILGGIISPIRGIGPKELKIENLVQLADKRQITEVILALNATIEGQATAFYIKEVLKEIKCSQLCSGVPVNGELDYLDSSTIGAAFLRRNII